MEWRRSAHHTSSTDAGWQSASGRRPRRRGNGTRRAAQEPRDHRGGRHTQASASRWPLRASKKPATDPRVSRYVTNIYAATTLAELGRRCKEVAIRTPVPVPVAKAVCGQLRTMLAALAAPSFTDKCRVFAALVQDEPSEHAFVRNTVGPHVKEIQKLLGANDVKFNIKRCVALSLDVLAMRAIQENALFDLPLASTKSHRHAYTLAHVFAHGPSAGWQREDVERSADGNSTWPEIWKLIVAKDPHQTAANTHGETPYEAAASNTHSDPTAVKQIQAWIRTIHTEGRAREMVNNVVRGLQGDPRECAIVLAHLIHQTEDEDAGLRVVGEVLETSLRQLCDQMKYGTGKHKSLPEEDAAFQAVQTWLSRCSLPDDPEAHFAAAREGAQRTLQKQLDHQQFVLVTNAIHTCIKSDKWDTADPASARKHYQQSSVATAMSLLVKRALFPSLLSEEEEDKQLMAAVCRSAAVDVAFDITRRDQQHGRPRHRKSYPPLEKLLTVAGKAAATKRPPLKELLIGARVESYKDVAAIMADNQVDVSGMRAVLKRWTPVSAVRADVMACRPEEYSLALCRLRHATHRVLDSMLEELSREIGAITSKALTEKSAEVLTGRICKQILILSLNRSKFESEDGATEYVMGFLHVLLDNFFINIARPNYMVASMLSTIAGALLHFWVNTGCKKPLQTYLERLTRDTTMRLETYHSILGMSRDPMRDTVTTAIQNLQSATETVKNRPKFNLLHSLLYVNLTFFMENQLSSYETEAFVQRLLQYAPSTHFATLAFQFMSADYGGAAAYLNSLREADEYGVYGLEDVANDAGIQVTADIFDALAHLLTRYGVACAPFDRPPHMKPRRR